MKTEALVLRAIDYGDADRVVTFYTAELGKLGTLARGARRSKRRFAGALEPFALLEIEIATGRGELARLDSAVVRRGFSGIARDLSAITMAGAGFELVREATPMREPDARLFATMIALLEALDQGADETVLLAFELRVLALLGHAPSLDLCAVCDKVAPAGAAAAFDGKTGSIVCQACGGGAFVVGGASRERMNAAMRGDAERGWAERVREDARRVIAAIVQSHLERNVRGAEAVATVEGMKK